MGGRQGLKEAYLYPDSFDGIAVGAPVWCPELLAGASLHWGLLNYPFSDPKHINSSLLQTVVQKVIEHCDAQDGLVDGIVGDAHGCHFDFDTLLCTESSDPSGCLTSEQVRTIKRFHSDWIGEDGTFIFPGGTLGADPTNLLGDGTGGMLPHGYFTYWVHNDTEWDRTGFSDKDVWIASTVNPGNASAAHYDFSAFHRRGGKIVHYHGDADTVIPSTSSIYYYKKVLDMLSGKHMNPDEFYRLFLIPGMDHCFGSHSAPWYIAASAQTLTGATHSVPGFEDAEHDVILALMGWVEEGVAPEKIIATKFRKDTVSVGVERQRPLCRYPTLGKYMHGDPDDAASWQCKEPLRR